MFSPNRRSCIGRLLLAGLVLAPSALVAQLTPAELEAEANRLHDDAMALATTTMVISETLPQVAARHHQSMTLRLVTDPRAFDCTMDQANLLALIGDDVAALAHLEHAAAIALANRDRASAAQAFIDAAILAGELGWDADRERLGTEALRLSWHPSLSRAEREAIQERIEFQPTA